MGYYRRERYLRRMRAFYHDDGLIKVVTGVRRCGKSCLMATVAEELSESGVDVSRIVFIDLDAKANRKVRTPDALEELIDSELPPAGETRYLFIDEVQNVKGFEEVVNGYRTDGGFSVFITGSNSYLLSGELATKLTGRYIEFDMGTLDFSEYLGMKRHLGKPVDANLDAEFNRYIFEGGFPKAVEYDELADKRAYVRGVIDEIFEKDVRRNRKIRHVSVFNAVRDYLVNNFGATTSVTNLLAHFNDRERVPIKRETLNRYIQVLVDAKVLNRCERFDMKSKQSLAREEKYYVADLGFYFALNTDNRVSYGPVLENIVYQHARTMGYAVSVGKIGRLECDFVLRRPDMGYAYVQVAMTIADEATEEREFRSLEAVRDNWPKYLLTMDRLLQRRGGVLHENVVDFLAEDRPF
jgi:predicted AAA+ superfamily ATPase